ncbi:uncharacterized protein LOC6638461 [Drosophila willistoni]|nr:uncharacterized protein LOC6638461 [Drosophila willistoni]
MFAFTWQVCLASLMMIATMTSLSSARPQLQEAPHALLDIETPNQFSYSSPLQQPDSLRSKPYFDFLSTLYAHDTDKTNLFRPYSGRPRREAVQGANHRQERQRRAIVFRPLFVYKQQEIRRQELREDQANRRNGQASALTHRHRF